MVRPADYPPPWHDAEAIAEPSEDEEAIDVGVLIVGAGPAGLAAAIRLGQLAAGDPATAERLGEVPVAVLEKGKGPGSHLLSGAVINPKPLYSLLAGLREPGDVPTYGKVPGESVLMLTPTRALPVPPPPTMRNHGNVIVSVSALGRWLAEVAEETGSMILPETSGQQLLVEAGKVVGVRTGDRGRGREGEPLGRFEPGSEIRAQVTILAEGTQGHLTGAAIDRFRLGGDSPQTWALGVKEVWTVPKPLRKIIHTMGWPLRSAAKYREFGGSFIYPMGEDMLTIGLVVGLDYTDSALSVHDLLQELKTHPRIRPLLEGGERVAWGAKTIPEGGYVAVPQKLWAPGVADHRRRCRARQRAGAQGDSLRDRVRAAGGRGGVARARARGAKRVAAELRRGAAVVVRLARPAEGAEHAAGVRARVLARRGPGGDRDGDLRPDAAGRQADAPRREPLADHD